MLSIFISDFLKRFTDFRKTKFFRKMLVSSTYTFRLTLIIHSKKGFRIRATLILKTKTKSRIKVYFIPSFKKELGIEVYLISNSKKK